MPRRRALTEAQLESLLALPAVEASLIRHWTLIPTDLAVVERRRDGHYQPLAGGSVGAVALHRTRQAATERVVESFSGRFRDECLNEHLFGNLPGARRTIEAWTIDYNTQRPPTSLNGLTPEAFAARPSKEHTENGFCL